MRSILIGSFLVAIAAAPLTGQEHWPGRDRLEAERCTPLKGDAAQWLRRADSATGLARLGDRILSFSGDEVSTDFFEADRTYPPFLSTSRQYKWWFDPTTGVERIAVGTTTTGAPLQNVVRTAAATFMARDTVLQANPQLHAFFASGRALSPLAVLRDWEAASGVAVSARCVFREYPRVVLTRANASDRLYLDEKTGIPVKFERTEPHYLWGQVLAEYVYATWWQMGPAILPLVSVRYFDGVEELRRAVALPPRAASVLATAMPRDSAPSLRLPSPLPDVAATPAAPVIVDTIRVGPNTVLLRSKSYTHAATLAADTLFLFDATTSEERSRADLVLLASLFPGRRPIVLVVTDVAWPHIAGVRFWAARGAIIVTHALLRPILEAVLARHWTLAPDALERARGKLAPRIRAVSGALALGGGAVQLHPIDGVASEGALVAFLPADSLLWASDYI